MIDARDDEGDSSSSSPVPGVNFLRLLEEPILEEAFDNLMSLREIEERMRGFRDQNDFRVGIVGQSLAAVPDSCLVADVWVGRGKELVRRAHDVEHRQVVRDGRSVRRYVIVVFAGPGEDIKAIIH